VKLKPIPLSDFDQLLKDKYNTELDTEDHAFIHTLCDGCSKIQKMHEIFKLNSTRVTYECPSCGHVRKMFYRHPGGWEEY